LRGQQLVLRLRDEETELKCFSYNSFSHAAQVLVLKVLVRLDSALTRCFEPFVFYHTWECVET
jgi:hypothetical protein